MGILQRLRVSTRMQLLVGITLVGLICLCLTALFEIRSTMLEDRKEKVRNLTEVAVATLTYYQQQAQSGKLTDEEAKQAAKGALRGIRFGQNDYFFIYYSNGVNFMHPAKPEFEGKNKRDVKPGADVQQGTPGGRRAGRRLCGIPLSPGRPYQSGTQAGLWGAL